MPGRGRPKSCSTPRLEAGDTPSLSRSRCANPRPRSGSAAETTISSGTRVRNPSAAKPSARCDSCRSPPRAQPRPVGDRRTTRRSRRSRDGLPVSPGGPIGMHVDHHDRCAAAVGRDHRGRVGSSGRASRGTARRGPGQTTPGQRPRPHPRAARRSWSDVAPIGCTNGATWLLIPLPDRRSNNPARNNQGAYRSGGGPPARRRGWWAHVFPNRTLMPGRQGRRGQREHLRPAMTWETFESAAGLARPVRRLVSRPGRLLARYLVLALSTRTSASRSRCQGAMSTRNPSTRRTSGWTIRTSVRWSRQGGDAHAGSVQVGGVSRVLEPRRFRSGPQ